ncbi:hypothetical protein ACVGVM_14470 [Pseudonocardia bannensis]|uniref:hypothetical protein n=1 Tax=Pseudonocardia bannensis TaxID=630973 RepID=UPI001B7D13D4|nr:hypothetical protein [Pseudonocardia bannensis]
MKTEARLDVAGHLVADMAASPAFYRRLGVAFPPDADDQPHVKASLPGGLRPAVDTEATARPENSKGGVGSPLERAPTPPERWERSAEPQCADASALQAGLRPDAAQPGSRG